MSLHIFYVQVRVVIHHTCDLFQMSPEWRHQIEITVNCWSNTTEIYHMPKDETLTHVLEKSPLLLFKQTLIQTHLTKSFQFIFCIDEKSFIKRKFCYTNCCCSLWVGSGHYYIMMVNIFTVNAVFYISSNIDSQLMVWNDLTNYPTLVLCYDRSQHQTSTLLFPCLDPRLVERHREEQRVQQRV